MKDINILNFRLLFNKFIDPEPKESSQKEIISTAQEVTDKEKALLKKSLNSHDELAKRIFESGTKAKRTKKRKIEVPTAEVEEVSIDENVKATDKNEIEHENEIQ